MLVRTIATAAEVLDKLTFPWEPPQYLRMLVVFVCAIMLATSKHPRARVAGLLVAIAWAMLSLWADPWFTPDIGNALRAELTTAQSSKWLQTILVQAMAPLAITLIVFLWKTFATKLRRQAPR